MSNNTRKIITAIELPENVAAALLVIAGKYGNGNERINALITDGYDYNQVQQCVNELMKVIEKYG